MTWNEFLNNTPIIKVAGNSLSERTVENAYRLRSKYYHTLDAEQQCLDYLENNNKHRFNPQLTSTDYIVLAERFDDSKDCNIADNATWEYVITDYLRENRIKTQ